MTFPSKSPLRIKYRVNFVKFQLLLNLLPTQHADFQERFGQVVRHFKIRSYMKKSLMYMIVLVALTISACSLQPLTTEQAVSTQQSVVTPTLVRNDLTWEESLLVSQLSDSTGASPDEILVASTEAITWPDHCLGIVRMDVICAQGEVPGFRFLLIAHNKEYEFHTNRDMTVIFLVDGE